MPYEPGETLVQADLARSLRLIAERGPAAFYGGPIGERIVAEVERAGGHLTIEDLRAYRPVVRAPVRGSYRGYEVVSMPPPSSGGVHIIQILNTLEDLPIGFLGHNGAETIHLMAEAMKYAYADRSAYLGDPDFVDVPVAALTSKAYAKEIRGRISTGRAAPAAEIGPGDLAPYESPETTHFSVVDEAGNAVANTYTLNFGYGIGLVAEGTGILLNNELDDFSAKPGVPNAYGLIGGDANAVGPGKRPLSSMAPTIVLQGRPAVPGHRQPRRPAHHHHHPAGDHERDRPRHERRRGDLRAAHPPPVAAGRAAHRAGHQPRHRPPARAEGPQGGAQGSDGLDPVDHGDRAWPLRQLRPAHSRCADAWLLGQATQPEGGRRLAPSAREGTSNCRRTCCGQ